MNGLIASLMRTAISRRPIGAASVLSTACAVGAVTLGPAAPMTVKAETASASAIGSANVAWLQVSPAYRTTGLVIAVASDLSCQRDCTHLWVTHNGGASWSKAAATGWNGGRPVIGSDAMGHDVLFAASSSGLQRSDDGGQTWQTAGAAGFMPQASPTFANDQTVAVAGQHDYVLRKGSSTPVKGSGGAYNDSQFFFAPGSPSGSTPPVFLTALGSQNTPVIQQCSVDLACHGGATLANESVGQMASFASLGFSTTYASDRVVFAQANRDIYKSVDAGGSFAPLAVLTPETPTAIITTPMMAIAPGYSENGPVRTLYTAVFEVVPDTKNPHTAGGVYASDNGGTSWHRAGSPSLLDHGADAVAVAPGGRLFAAYLSTAGGQAAAGLLCSADGKAWQATCPSVGTAAAGAPAASSDGHGANGPAGSSNSQGQTAAAAPGSPGAGSGDAGGASTGSDGKSLTGSAVDSGRAGGSSAKFIIAAVIAAVALALMAARLVMRRRDRAI